ncbi:MAG: hypothetical protein ABJC63_10535 [Gemmatimonadales bacterium]
MRIRSVDDLPRYSAWPARLLGSERWEQRVKNRAEIEREYQLEKWGSLLVKVEESPWPLSLADLDLIMQGGDELVVYADGPDLFETTAKDAHLRYRDFVANILKDYLPASSLVELGAGYGSVIVDMARRPEFTGVPSFGLELTATGTQLIKHMSTVENVNVTAGECDMLARTVTEVPIPSGAVVFTSYAACYEPRLEKSFLKGIAALRPKAVVLIEPCYEHCDESTLLGLLRRRYIEVNDYNTNLATLLHEEREAGSVKILDERKAAFGPNPLLAASVIVWEPAERS